MSFLNLPEASRLSRRFRYSYRALLFSGTWRHSFDLVGADGALSLNVSGPHRYNDQDNWSAGLEIHRRAPADYQRNDPPSHDDCHVLKAPCWHDGTSLYAQERFLPVFLAGDIDRLIVMLSHEAEERFPAIDPEVSR